MEAPRFDDEPEENTGSRNYQKEADRLREYIYDRVIPDLEGQPPTEKMGMQRVELLDAKDEWDSIDLVVLPCDGFPNPVKPQKVARVQFIESPEGTEMRHITEVGVNVLPGAEYIVELTHKITYESGDSSPEIAVPSIPIETIVEIASVIEVAKVKPVRIE